MTVLQAVVTAGFCVLGAGMCLWGFLSASKRLTEETDVHVLERAEWGLERLRIIDQFRKEREWMIQQHQVERAELLNRIDPSSPQYPLIDRPAVVEPPPTFSDEEYWANIPKSLKDLATEAVNDGIHEA